MWSRFKGKGLLAFSDPAGAKACLALNEILCKESISGERKLVSNKEYPFYSQFKSDIEIIDNGDVPDFTKKLTGKIDWIFTGTSHPDSSGCFELRFLENADVRSHAFIDHWTNFHLRFELGSKMIFPDTIFVIDESAKQSAVADGLPEERIELLENPYLMYLRQYGASNLTREEFCKKLNIESKKKIILYAPDPVSLRKEGGQNETDILKELMDKEITNNFTVVLKLHPLQPLGEILTLIEQNDLKIITDDKFMPSDVFANADIIVGFYSNYLLEAATVNKNIIRYQLEGNDRLMPAPAGKMPGRSVADKRSLLTELNNIR